MRKPPTSMELHRTRSLLHDAPDIDRRIILGHEERANYHDTGFPECNECYARRVSEGAFHDLRAKMFGDDRGLPPNS